MFRFHSHFPAGICLQSDWEPIGVGGKKMSWVIIGKFVKKENFFFIVKGKQQNNFLKF